MVGYIYLITDTTNGMKYTGQHHYHIEGQLDPNYHGSGTIIKNIYKKRHETLKEEYIKTCYSEEEMCSDEQYYIKLFKTLYPNGYNLTEGGEGCVACEETRKKISESISGEKHPMFGKHHSEESKKKISDAHKGKPGPNKGKPMSEEQKKKLSFARKGIPSPNKGKHLSEDYKRKISDSKKGKMVGDKNPFYGKHHTEEFKKKMSKKVLQFTLDRVFIREWESTMECGRNGYSQSAVSECCQGKRKSHKGFIFKYKEE